MPGPWEQYATPAQQTAPPAAAASGPWSQYAPPAAAADPNGNKDNYGLSNRNYGPAPTPDTPPEKQGMFSSFYDGAIGPVVDMVKDAFDRQSRGEIFGEHAAGEILDSFKDQLKNFAGHPDIRNLPVIGTGATATAARMQKQYDAGNYAGMIGSAAGFIAPFATPAAIDSAPGAAAAVGGAVKSAAQKLRNVLPDGPIVSPLAADVVGSVNPAAGFGLRAVNKAGAIANKVLGPKTPAAAALSPGDQILADMRASAAAKTAEDAAYDRLPATPAEPAEPAPAQPAAAQAQPPAAAAAAPRPAAPVPDQYTAQPEDFQKSWEPGPPGTPAPAQAWAPYAPDARASLPPELVAKVDALRAQTHPGLAQQQLEDLIDEHAAYLQHQAEDMIWANRARKADRFAQYLTENKLDPTPANLAKAAKAMDERGAPSDETVPMIQDRMGYTEPASAPSASEQPAPAPTALEQQLADSVALFNKSKAAFDAAKAKR